MIQAKAVVDQKYWILKKDDQKIGILEAHDNGYVISTNGERSWYKTIPMIQKRTNISFEPVYKILKADPYQVHGYSTGCKVYNPVWNVQMQVPLFTKKNKSRSWLAAGWYIIKKHRSWQKVRNPKLILLERYPYKGPYHNEDQANEHI